MGGSANKKKAIRIAFSSCLITSWSVQRLITAGVVSMDTRPPAARAEEVISLFP